MLRVWIPQTRKRRFSTETEPTTTPSSSPTSTKRQKLDIEPRHTTPASFWDNLSHVPLVPRALKEFDRRIVPVAVPAPPDLVLLGANHSTRLKRFARLGGPDLRSIRAYPEPAVRRFMSESQSGSRSRASFPSASNRSTKPSTRKSSAYDPGFEQHLIDHGIYPEGHDDEGLEEPNNSKEIMDKIKQRRPSLSPSRFSRKDFLNFKQLNRDALTEKTVMRTIFPIVAGPADIHHAEDLPFRNLKDLTDGSISKAQPDFYDGSRPSELKKRVREDLGPFIVPSTNKSAPCLPNFFAEGKGPNGSAPIAKRQAVYDGALGARGVNKLQSYVDPELTHDNIAYTITSTYHGGTGTLSLYTTHLTPSRDSELPIEFRMTHLDSFAMTGNLDAFRQGATALRNARDWAKEQRDLLIAKANSQFQLAVPSDLISPAQSFQSQLVDEGVIAGSDTSVGDRADHTEPDARPERSVTEVQSSRSSSRRSRKRAIRKRSKIGYEDRHA